MLKGLYTSAQGLAVLNRQHEVTANNLANTNTVGYKKDRMVASSFPEMFLAKIRDRNTPGEVSPVGSIATGVAIDQVYTDHSSGILRHSDNPLALAISGEGYFVVSTPQGERYTRNGDFHVDAAGRVVTSSGYALQGQKGDLVAPNGDFVVDREGRVLSNGVEIDTLRIVRFATPLTKEGDALFSGDNPVEVENPLLQQGFVEESNVQVVEEMITMIQVMRSYEANQKVMQTLDGTLDKAVNEVGRV
jgi:flagellar basal-body rod protein FlgG